MQAFQISLPFKKTFVYFYVIIRFLSPMSTNELTKLDPWLKSFEDKINQRIERFKKREKELSGGGSLSDFANGHLFYGLQKTESGWIYRDWLPNASEVYLTGSFNNWMEQPEFALKKGSAGQWELSIPREALKHGDLFKLKVHWKGGSGERIPAWAKRVVQDEATKIFSTQVWDPAERYVWKTSHFSPEDNSPFIYESHIGMATEELRTGTYREFRENILPVIKKAGYNTIQIMAIQEHPYYGSFGYHVSSFFAPSSRFGTPEELKELVDEAHAMGLAVIMDLVHSHAVKNVNEGLGCYDGTEWQYFHKGERRNHAAWDSLCFDYGKNEVIHFLLSNCKYWLDEFRFDGFRFDGITSMLYLDHGLNRDFTEYGMYFDGQQDEDAICYLSLANKLCKLVKTHSLTIAEEMSGFPGLTLDPVAGGVGFDYRMSMGTPDYWIKIIKELPDEEWNMEEMFFELSQKRPEEKTVGYAESHDQALVGDKTIIFRLIDKEMYFSMAKSQVNLKVDRGIALHKMIRLITLATAGDSYLNFMGNEFGHPEWIDFPREGNNWSYQYARRQWSLASDKNLRYHFLGDFDKAMITLARDTKIPGNHALIRRNINNADKILCFERANLLFIFNFHPEKSYTDYGISCQPGKYRIRLSTDDHSFGGQDRVKDITYRSMAERSYAPAHMLKIYIPSRTAIVLERMKIKSVY